jgi:hypothetical protein
MKKIILIVLLTVGVVFSAHSQTKRQDIIRLLEVMDTKSQAAQMFDLMLPSLQSMVPEVPTAFWTVFRSRLDLESFVNLLIPIYDRNFSHDDIKELIQFYESPIGMRLLEATPQITIESYTAGQEWGQKMGRDVVNELVRQGYITQ